MAGNAKPDMPDLGDEVKIELISFWGSSVNTSTASDASALLDGITIKQGTYNAALMSTTHNSYLEFSISSHCNLWAVGGSYSDTGGSTPKQIKLQKWVGEKYEDVGIYNTTSSHDWYLLCPSLAAGKYKVTAAGNYVAFNEWYAESMTPNKSLIQLNNGEYRTYRDTGWEVICPPVTSQLFAQHGMTDLSIIPPEAWQELVQLSPTVEIVTYVPEGNKVKSFAETYMDIPLRIDMKALPFEQLLVQPSDFELHGSLLAIIANQLPVQAYEGRCQFILSFDGGVTWEVFRNGRWKSVNAADMAKVRELGMSFKALARIKEAHFQDKGSQLRIGYYLDESIHREEEVKLDHSRLVARSALDDVKVKDLSLSLLNTKASIELKLTGNKLTGRLDDPDKGKVQYRVLLNDKPYFPANGEFTRLAASPVDINLTISERDIVFNQENKLRVEYQDYWGETESWETKFIGSYSGLMFMDETGNYYSDTFGGILKYLDFDMLIAGQTSLDQKVVVKNQLGYSITNLTLKTVNESLPDGVAIELSRKSSPFLPVDSLLYSEVLHQGDTVECYVRIATEIDAKPTPDGRFEIRAYANRI
ncbi:filamentous hemagglutinin family outer membrane protein [Paenibacillus thiaminolyticus]|nr:filamentous hemagglutinin family outer membrane protein [Paenibacillus thiaminolyticus]